MLPSRRSFLKSAAAVVATAPLVAQTFPTAARDRLAVTSYPFRSYISTQTGKPGMDLKEFPGMIAKRFGVFNINPLGDHLSSIEPAYLDSFRKAVADAKSHLVDLGLGGRDFGNPDRIKCDEAIAYGRKWIDIAAMLGSPSVRQHLRTAAGMPPSVSKTAESLSRLAEYGAKKSIVINLENDSPGAEDPFFIIEVLGKVNSPYLRGLPDFGNSIRGHDAAYNRRAVDGMFKYAWNMSHVKDLLHVKDGEEYHVDVPQMFDLARDNKGYFSMEFDTASGDPFTGTDNLIEQSLKYI